VTTAICPYAPATPMELSAFSVLDGHPTPSENSGRYSEVLDLAMVAEAAGLRALWIAEHHFHSGGLCPSPPVLLAAMSQRTRRLRLGAMVSVLPFHDPIRLAEQYAMVDRLSNGRLDIGLGSGYIPMEFEGFGVDPSTKRERFDDGFDRFVAALEGRGFRAPGGGATEHRLNVRPVQQPHPPLWIAAQRREALPFIARKGLSIALIPYATVRDVAELAEEIREFRAALPAGSGAKVSVAAPIYCLRDRDQGLAALQRYLDSRRATQSAFYEAKVRADPRWAMASAIAESGLALVGPPADIVGGLHALRRAGADEVLALVDGGITDAGQLRESVMSLGSAWAAETGK